MKRFGEKLRVLRTKHKLTIRQLASDLDLKSSGHITDLEKSRVYPSMPLFLKITQFFNVSADQLINDELELD